MTSKESPQDDALEDIHEWISSKVSVHGEIRQVHKQPWSTVFVVGSDEGKLFFKETSATLSHEASLTFELSQIMPDRLPELIAFEADRNWLLMRDAGDTLRSITKNDGTLERWEISLHQYAELQIEASKHIDRLASTGCFDRRMSTFLVDFKRLIEEDIPLLREDRRKLRQLASTFDETFSELQSCGIPNTIHHDDFHDANVFVKGKRTTFADWGESAIAHPFLTMTIVQRSAAYTLGIHTTSPEIENLMSGYLRCFDKFADSKDTAKALSLAKPLGKASRALTWFTVAKDLEGKDRDSAKKSAAGWAIALFDDEV